MIERHRRERKECGKGPNGAGETMCELNKVKKESEKIGFPFLRDGSNFIGTDN